MMKLNHLAEIEMEQNEMYTNRNMVSAFVLHKWDEGKSYYLKLDSFGMRRVLGESDCRPESKGEFNCSPTSDSWKGG